MHLNWSSFKPEFSGKPEEDAEAHLLHSNNWMDAHHFNEDIKVQRFCLTLLGKARLWYQSLEPLRDPTWAQLQNLIRQRCSKLGNTCEQLFHAWRSFTFDENTEDYRFLCDKNKTGSKSLRVGRATDIRGIQEPFTNKNVLDFVSNRRPQTSCRHCKKNTDQRETGQTADRSNFH